MFNRLNQDKGMLVLKGQFSQDDLDKFRAYWRALADKPTIRESDCGDCACDTQAIVDCANGEQQPTHNERVIGLIRENILEFGERLIGRMIRGGAFKPDENGILNISIDLGALDVSFRERGPLEAWYMKAKADGAFRPQFA
jgi:hypothetical protein